ncbi:MAG TPA: ribbon-helix-helix protein, CopG family [Cyanophyceae cyanobacterium]
MPKEKRGRGQPRHYDENKEKVTVRITPTAIASLDSLATQLNISRSEFVERLARGDGEAIALLTQEKQGRQMLEDSREDQPIKTKKKGRSLQELRKILGTDNPP